MDKKTTCIVAYAGIIAGLLGLASGILGMLLPLIVWAVAYFAGDKAGAKMHLNQSLVLILIGIVGSLIGFIPLLGVVVNFVILILTIVLGIMGMMAAVKGQDKVLPIIGKVQILK